MSLKDKELTLERLELEDEIASREMSIAQKKSVEKEMKKKHGRNWRKILSVDTKKMMDLYAVNPELREMTRPYNLRRHR